MFAGAAIIAVVAIVMAHPGLGKGEPCVPRQLFLPIATIIFAGCGQG
jgi:hypothetical protein